MQEVVQLKIVERTKVTSVDEAFSYRPGLGWKWLQWLCCLFMREIGAHYPEKSYIRNVVTFEPEEFMKRLLERHRNLVEMYNYRDIDRLLIGAKDFDEMMCTDTGYNMFRFNAEYAINRKIMGMRVQVVPWMSGMLLLPKED